MASSSKMSRDDRIKALLGGAGVELDKSVEDAYRRGEATADNAREPERMAEPGEPAWKCGHPRTPENTHGPFKSHPGQCAECHRRARRVADAKYAGTLARTISADRYRRRKAFERVTAHIAEHYGEEYVSGDTDQAAQKRQAEAAASRREKRELRRRARAMIAEDE